MENKNKENNNHPQKNISIPKIDIYKNKNFNNDVLPKYINYNISNFNTNNKKTNINFNSHMNNLKNNEIEEPMESNFSSNIYERNIALLNDKIKEQENDIIYLNDRLKNYDNTMEEITNLNIEINRLNEIIKNKNNIIQEYIEISELSKQKLEDLISNRNNLIQKIKSLEKENNELRNITHHRKTNTFDIKEYDTMKSDINDLIKENKELKKNLQEKNEEIENMHNIITSKNLNSSKYMNYIPHHRKYNNYNFGFEQENSLRTEPNIYPEMFGAYSTYRKNIAFDKYNYLKNKYSIEPLKYSNFLLDNLQNNISNNYLNLK